MVLAVNTLTNPTVTAFAIQPSCTNNNINSDGYLQVSETDGDKLNFSIGSTYTGPTDYNDGSNLIIGTLPFKFNMGLDNPNVSQDYTIRVFNGDSNFFTDVVVTMNEQDCTVSCNCKEYIYLNDTGEDSVHKLEIDEATGSLTEAPERWLPSINNPHGLGTDLNGRLYIGEVNSSFSAANIQQLTCDGEVLDANFYTYIRFITNASSDDNNLLYLYGQKIANNEAKTIEVLDLCTGARVGCNATGLDGWGFYVKGGTFWATNFDCNDPIHFGNVADFTNNCNTTIPTQSFNVPSSCLGGTTYTPRGIFVDNVGFVYVVYNSSTSKNGGAGAVYVVKYNPDGTIKAQSGVDNTQSDGGWYGARGIVADESGRVYIGSKDGSNAAGTQSCISVFEDDDNGNLNFLFQVNNEAGTAGSSKGLSIAKECCPTNNNVTIDTTICGDISGTTLFLQDLINCDGIICEGIWEEGTGNTGMTYNACDNSVTIDNFPACGTFILNSDGTSTQAQCGAFAITVNISTASLDFTVEPNGNCVDNQDGTFTQNYNAVVDWAVETCQNGEMITAYHNDIVIGIIDPTSDNSPTIFPVAINADGNGRQRFRAEFTFADCIDSVAFKTPLPCPENVSGANAPAEVCQGLTNSEIGGTVFEDWDYDGAIDQSNTVGVQGIQVNLLEDCENVTQTTYTDSNGNYQFIGLTDGTTYRVEFSLPESVACWAKPTKAGPDNGTTIQFVQPGDCANLGIANPDDYCPENEAQFVAVCFTLEENNDPAVVSWAVTGGANTTTANDYIMPSDHPIKIDVSEVKCVWGLAYDQRRQALYQSANLKDRTSPANSLGNIFVTDNSSNDGTDAKITTADVWMDLNSLAYFNGALGTYTGNDDPAIDGVDDESFAKTHKVGIGDIDLNTAGDTLFATDLANRRLLGIPISNNGTPSSFSAITKNNVPVPASCDASLGDTLRVFGLEVYKDKVYVGCVCDAGGTKDITNLDAFVYEYSSATGFNTTPVLSVDLDYNREASSGSPRAGNANSDGAWTYWTDDVTESNWRIRAYATNQGFGVRPSPSLSDIEFINGNMVLGFSDRTADQLRRIDAGHAKNPFVFKNNNSNPFMFVLAVGDVLMAGNNGDGTWTIENNGIINSTTSNTLTTNGSFSGAGPGGREFFYEDDYARGNHYETMTGTLQRYPGKNILIAMGWDPYRRVGGEFGSGGAFYFDAENGDWLKSYALFGGPAGGNFNFGKGNSFGDVELLCPPAPIEIGNYVWEDTDSDGIQDACESPIGGVRVSLYKNGTKIAETQTSISGQYYFSDKDATDVNLVWSGMDADTMLLPNMEYKIVFGESQYANNELTIGGENYSLTIQNGGTNDWIDNDAMEMDINGTIFPAITAMPGDYGCTDHSFDVGFIVGCPPEICLPIKATVKKN